MSNTQNDVQIGVGMDATGVDRSAQAIEGRVQRMAGNVAKEGERAGKGVEAIGAGSERAAREVERSERSIVASIQRRTAAIEAAGKGERAYQEALISNRGMDPAKFQPYLDQLEAADRAHRVASGSLDKIGVSAKQTAAALRGVPAQFTDIITSLQGGQAPLTVFLQQGGQLKDMFGGAGAAAKALGGYVLGLINPLTVGAAALGVIAYGYNKGASEGQAFERTLISTGRASGATAGQLTLMAAAIDRMGGATRGQASAALDQMAASGQVGAANLQRFTQAAIELERSGGQAVQKTVDAFAELGRDPLKASLKFNESMNYLTRSTYEQIKALEDQGRTVEAAKLAQESYFDAVGQRTPEMEKQLSLVERSWRGVKDMISQTVDAVANFGRGGNIGSEIERVAKEAARLRAAANNQGVAKLGDFAESITGGRSLAQQATDAEALLAKLRESARLSAMMAEQQAEQARGVKLLAEYRKDEERFLSRSEQLNRAITREITQGVQAGETMERIQTRVVALRKQYAEKSSGGRAARELEAEADMLARLSGYTATYNNDLARLIALRNKGAISEAQYGDEVRKLVALQPAAVREAKALAAAQEAAAAAYKKVIGELDGVLSRQEREVQSLQDQYIAMTAGKEALEQMRAAREGNALALAEEALQTAYMTAASAEEIARRLQIIETLKQEIALRQGLATATANKEVDAANTQAAANAQREWERVADQVGQSLADALMQGGKSAAEYIKGLFRTMVLRPVLQAAVQPYANAVLGLLGQGQGQGAAGQAGQYLQGAQSLQTLYGYGQSAYTYAAGAGYFGTGAAASVSPAAAAGAYGGAAGEVVGAGAGSTAAGASSFAAYAGWAALAVAAAIQAQKDYDQGFNRDSSSNSGTALGDASARSADLFSRLGINDEWADIISGATLTARLFGRAAPQITGSGVQGSLGGGRFTGQAYADVYEKGGLFRSGNSYQQFAALPEDLARFMDAAAKGVLDKAAEFGAALGLPVDALAKVTTDIKLNLGDALGNNEEDIKQALAQYGDALVAGWADAVKPLALYGETAVQTIERVGAAIGGTNQVLELLGVGLLDTSVAGGQAAAALASAFGSLDNLTQASAAYYQNYFTEAERAAKATDQLGKALAEVGLAVPAGREQFRALVEGLDLATEAGRQQFLMLMSVQQAFAELNPVAEQTAQVLRSTSDVLRERQGLELELMRLQGDTAGIRALERAALDSTNQALYDQIRALEDTQAAAAVAAQVAAESAQAAERAAAEATAAQQQREAEKSGLELQLLQLQGKTVEIRARERAALLTDEARALYDQINSLKDAQAAWRDVAGSAVAAATDTRSAWTSAWAGMADEVRRLRGGQATGQDALLADFATTTAQARAGDAGAAGRLAGLSKSLSDAGQMTAATKADFQLLQAKLAASLERTLELTGAPAEQLAGLRADFNTRSTLQFDATMAQLTLLRRVSVVLDGFENLGMPGVRAS